MTDDEALALGRPEDADAAAALVGHVRRARRSILGRSWHAEVVDADAVHDVVVEADANGDLGARPPADCSCRSRRRYCPHVLALLLAAVREDVPFDPVDVDGAERALEALRQGDPRAALVAALACWRVSRDPELAELVDQLGRTLAADRPPIAGKTRAARHAAWIERARARDPRDLTLLLDARTAAGIKPTVAGLRVLETWPDDPRFVPALVEDCQVPPFTSETFCVYYTIATRILCRLGDPRTPALDMWMLGEANQQRLAERRATLRPVHPVAPATLEALRDALSRPAAAAPANEAELMARILADPDDDAARLVYGDQLQERGDPRGEFIRLQIDRHQRGESTPTARKREKALWSEHHETWLGPPAAFLTRETRFERGFLDHAAFRVDPTVIARNWATWEAHRDDPLWQTATSIHARGWDTARVLPVALIEPVEEPDYSFVDWLLALPRVRQLASGSALLHRVEQLGRPLPYEALQTSDTYLLLPSETLAAFGRGAAWPHLRRLRMESASREQVETLLHSPLVARLERFEVEMPFFYEIPFARYLALVAAAGHPTATFAWTATRRRPWWHLDARWLGDGWAIGARFSGRWKNEREPVVHLDNDLQLVAEPIRTLTYQVPRKLRDARRARLARIATDLGATVEGLD